VDVCDEDKDRYRFGYNGQEKVNEIAGVGNHNTAEFWEYDTRLGRRWNLDPQYKKMPALSPYSTFNLNPVIYNDKKGDIGNFVIGFVMGFVTDVVCQVAVNIALGKPTTEIDLFDAVVAGGVGALTSGFSTQATIAKATTRIAQATGLSGKIVSRSIDIGAVITEEGIKAVVDIKLKTDENEMLEVQSVFGTRKKGTNGVNDPGNIKSGADAAVDLVAGTVMTKVKDGISTTTKSIVNKKLTKEQSHMFTEMRRSMIGSARSKSYKLKYEEIGEQINMNEKVTDFTTDLLIDPVKDNYSDKIKESVKPPNSSSTPSESGVIYKTDAPILK